MLTPSQDRRYGYRLPLELYLNTYVADRPARGFTTNLSETGLYVSTLSRDRLAPRTPVGLEFALPGIPETIWAAGEMCYDTDDDYFTRSGIRFTAMANLHARMLREFLKQTWRQRYRGPRLRD
jgi:hypothetical protein